MRTFAWVPIFSLFLIGCGDTDNNGDAGLDMGAGVDGGDMATGGGGDMSGLQCSMTDPMTDIADCSGTFVCPSGQICVQDTPGGSAYHCKLRCDTGGQVIPALCPCDRACLTLTNSDGGVVGAGCILGNTPGERCGTNGGTPIFGTGSCAQSSFCTSQGPSAPAYCLWTCTSGGNECPAQTTCQPVMDNMGNTIGLVCAYNYGASGIPGNAACTAVTDTCQTGFICDGTKCQPQCNGPGDNGVGKTCVANTCTAVNDPAKSNKVIGYVCK